jgi:hypothetical protein
VCLGNLVAQVLADEDHQVGADLRTRLAATSRARDARRLLLLAAAEPTGDPVLVLRAAGRQGIGAAAAGPASEAGLAEFGLRVRFPHPLGALGGLPVSTGSAETGGAPGAGGGDRSGTRS